MNTLNKEQPNLRCEYDNKEVMEEVRYRDAPAFLKKTSTPENLFLGLLLSLERKMLLILVIEQYITAKTSAHNYLMSPNHKNM